MLKEWANISNVSLARDKSDLLSNFSNLQFKMEEGEVTKNGLMEERDFCGKIHIANRKEEEVWNLRSQSLWLKLGDKNTTFFHKETKFRL